MVRFSRFSFLLFLISNALLSPISAQEHVFKVIHENGVRIAESTGGPKYTGELFYYNPILTLQEDNREESILHSPGQYLIDAQGYFFVADSGNQRIVVFDSGGRYSHSFGRLGGGPGEFQYVQLQYIRDEIVSVYDFSARRTSRFQADGSLIDVFTIPPDAGDTFRSATRTEEDEHVLISLEIPLGGEFGLFEWMSITVIDSLKNAVWKMETDKVKTRYLGVLKAGGRENSEAFWYQYGARPMCVYHHEHGIVYSSGWEPTLQCYDLDGNLRQIIRVDLEPERINRQEKRKAESFLDRLVERNRGYIGDLIRSEKESLEYPSQKAYWSDIEIDDLGYIWLQLPMYRWFEADSNKGGLFYRVFSPDGEYLGITQRPEGSSRASRGNLVVSYRNVETEAIIPTVYAIVPNAEGFIYPN